MLSAGSSVLARRSPSSLALLKHSRRLAAFGRASQGTPGHRGSAATAARSMYTAVEFEVYGVVQGVFFRGYTTDKARQLGLVGFCQNVPKGTVKGEIQGQKQAVEEMKVWLSTTGSPHSVIERCDFSAERQIEALEYTSFSTRRR